MKTYRFEQPLYGQWTELREIPNDYSRYWCRTDGNNEWFKSYYGPGEDFKVVLNFYRTVLLWNEIDEGAEAFAHVGLDIMDADDELDKVEVKQKCKCEMETLWSHGCKCGGI